MLRLALAADPRRAQCVLGSDGHLFATQSRGGERLPAIQREGGKLHRRIKPEQELGSSGIEEVLNLKLRFGAIGSSR
jgi:hypothetical protein